jgi:hypothetical protein
METVARTETLLSTPSRKISSNIKDATTTDGVAVARNP